MSEGDLKAAPAEASFHAGCSCILPLSVRRQCQRTCHKETMGGRNI